MIQKIISSTKSLKDLDDILIYVRSITEAQKLNMISSSIDNYKMDSIARFINLSVILLSIFVSLYILYFIFINVCIIFIGHSFKFSKNWS